MPSADRPPLTPREPSASSAQHAALSDAVRFGTGVLVSISGLGAALLLVALRDPGGIVLLETLGGDATRARALIAAALAAACGVAGTRLWLGPIRGPSAVAKVAGGALGLVLAVPATFVGAALAYALTGLLT